MIVFRALWSVVAWTLAFAIMGVAFTLVLIACPFVPYATMHHRGVAQLIGFVPYLTLSRMTITYHPDFDPDRVSMFVQNHISMLDGHVAAAVIPGVFSGLQNAAHLKIPFYGWLNKLANAIAVPKRGTPNRRETIAAAFKERTGRGINVLTFPEGHRTLDGNVRPFRYGIFLIARDAGVPVVPVAVGGSYKVLRKGTWIINPGHFDVYVGAQIETKGLTDEQVAALADGCRESIQGWLDRRDALSAPELRVSAADA